MTPEAATWGIAPGFDATSATDGRFEGATVAQLERRTSYTARELLAETFPEPRFAVPGLIAEGLNVYCAPPKAGKSWLALNLALAIAGGTSALGTIPVERGPVLYLALEDGRVRLQKRLRSILGGDEAPDDLFFETEWPKLSEGGTERLEAFLSDVPETRLVIVDVFAKVRQILNERADRYSADYAAVEPLKGLFDKYAVAGLLLHHTRKAASDDFLETVSGTHGIAGAADSVLVMRRTRGQADAELHVTGRDIEEKSYALRFDPNVGTWTLLGDAAEWQLSESRRKILEALKVATRATPKQLTDYIEGAEYENIKKACQRMASAEQIVANGDGTYSPLPINVSLPSLESPRYSGTGTAGTEGTGIHRGDADA
jgi:RecA-family ATPase